MGAVEVAQAQIARRSPDVSTGSVVLLETPGGQHISMGAGAGRPVVTDALRA
jgi:hypothetical protein